MGPRHGVYEIYSSFFVEICYHPQFIFVLIFFFTYLGGGLST